MAQPTSNLPRVLGAGAAYFALVFAAGFALGSIRVPWLLPRFGERVAELIETPFMLVAVVLAARFVVRRHGLPARPGVRLAVGGMALALLLAAEFAFSALLQQRSPREFILDRDPVAGAVFALMLLLFALMPCLLGRLQPGRPAA